jgi:predicted O-methyltransferase YrrM
MGASIYSCDINADKVSELRRRAGARVDNMEFIFGDSVESLRLLAARHPQFNFLFLDAAASAMHTFREFQAAEAVRTRCAAADRQCRPAG